MNSCCASEITDLLLFIGGHSQDRTSYLKGQVRSKIVMIFLCVIFTQDCSPSTISSYLNLKMHIVLRLCSSDVRVYVRARAHTHTNVVTVTRTVHC